MANANAKFDAVTDRTAPRGPGASTTGVQALGGTSVPGARSCGSELGGSRIPEPDISGIAEYKACFKAAPTGQRQS